MRYVVIAICLGVVCSACKGKTCTTQTAESFIGEAPDSQLADSLKKLAAANKVCGTSQRAYIVLSGSRSSAVDTLALTMKGAGFHEVPGRGRTEGSTIVVSYAKAKDATNVNLVELAVSPSDECAYGDVCVTNYGYSVDRK